MDGEDDGEDEDEEMHWSVDWNKEVFFKTEVNGRVDPDKLDGEERGIDEDTEETNEEEIGTGDGCGRGGENEETKGEGGDCCV